MSCLESGLFLETPPSNLICLVCHNVVEHPSQAPCGHIFCKVCIEQWLIYRSTCPVCRGNVSSNQLSNISKKLRSQWQQLDLWCTNKDRGCKRKWKVVSYLKHINKCGFNAVTCPNADCGLELTRRTAPDHQRVCPFLRTTCGGPCRLPVLQKDKETHNCVTSLAEMVKSQQEELRSVYRMLSQVVREPLFDSALLHRLHEAAPANHRSNFTPSSTIGELSDVLSFSTTDDEASSEELSVVSDTHSDESFGFVSDPARSDSSFSSLSSLEPSPPARRPKRRRGQPAQNGVESSSDEESEPRRRRRRRGSSREEGASRTRPQASAGGEGPSRTSAETSSQARLQTRRSRRTRRAARRSDALSIDLASRPRARGSGGIMFRNLANISVRISDLLDEISTDSDQTWSPDSDIQT